MSNANYLPMVNRSPYGWTATNIPGRLSSPTTGEICDNNRLLNVCLVIVRRNGTPFSN